MSFAKKIKDIRTRFALSEETLANILDLNKEEILKWEKDLEKPNKETLNAISKILNISNEKLLDNKFIIENIVIKKQLNKNDYKNKLSSYETSLKEYFSDYEIYILTREKKMNFISRIFDFIVGGLTPEMFYPIHTKDVISDLSPYYLLIKDNKKILVNIKKWILEIIELPYDTNEEKFEYNTNIFKNHGKLKLKN